MKIFSSRRQRYVDRVSILLIMVTLMAGMVGCGGGGGGGGESYTLTVNSTAGGVVAVNNVTIPGKTMFTYDPGTVVSLNATPSAGYHFINWTGNGTVVNVTAANTTITMNGDYSITANFVAVYSLTITSFGGGTVTTPGVGTFTRDAGTVVNLVATPNADYRFVNWTGDVITVANVTAASTTITMNDNYSITANFAYTPMVAAGYSHTVGLKVDGTVVAVGDNSWGQCDVGNWTDIIQIAAGGLHTVGLKADGTVVAVGDSGDGQCDVGNWMGIIQVAAGGWHTVGVKSDGTVVAVGDNSSGQCDVGGWADIVQVAAGRAHTVGLNKSDGTVVAVGYNYPYGQCDVGGWADIVQVAAGGFHTVGLKADGTVVAVGWNDDGQCDVSGWDLF